MTYFDGAKRLGRDVATQPFGMNSDRPRRQVRRTPLSEDFIDDKILDEELEAMESASLEVSETRPDSKTIDGGPRKRGRPRKYPPAQPPPPDLQVVKRPRGRPRGKMILQYPSHIVFFSLFLSLSLFFFPLSSFVLSKKRKLLRIVEGPFRVRVLTLSIFDSKKSNIPSNHFPAGSGKHQRAAAAAAAIAAAGVPAESNASAVDSTGASGDIHGSHAQDYITTPLMAHPYNNLRENGSNTPRFPSHADVTPSAAASSETTPGAHAHNPSSMLAHGDGIRTSGLHLVSTAKTTFLETETPTPRPRNRRKCVAPRKTE